MRRSRSQQDVDLARRMRAAGIPLEIEEDDNKARSGPPTGVFIQQVGASTASDVAPHVVGYTLDLRIVPNLPWPLEISEIKLDLPWEDPSFRWLADPMETGAKYEMYWFPGNATLAYGRDEVINHFVGSGHRFDRGRSLAGLLLGVGSEMPDHVRPGTVIPAILKVLDQFGSEYSCPIRLGVNRKARPFYANNDSKSRRKPLLACRDPQPR